MFRAPPPKMMMMCAAAPPMDIVESAQYARRCSVSDDSGRADSSGEEDALSDLSAECAPGANL